MEINLKDNKKYIRCRLSEDASIFRGYYQEYLVTLDIMKKLAKDLGFSYDSYLTLAAINPTAADEMVKSLSNSSHPEIILLADEEVKEIISYSLDSERSPILNTEFVQKVLSLSGTSDEIELSELYYHKDDTIASVIIKKKSPIVIEEKYENKESKIEEYSIGILLANDESSSAYCRLVLYVEGQPLYLPASYYNVTTSRYRRSTLNSIEALEVLMLRIIDDLREKNLYNKIYDIHYRYRANKYILASYEEYNTVLKTMRRIPTIIEDNSILETLLSKYENFERKYINVEDQKSSYIWRCTALSDITVGALISITSNILCELGAPALEYYAIRELLGNYISTNRIAEEIAREEVDHS